MAKQLYLDRMEDDADDRRIAREKLFREEPQMTREKAQTNAFTNAEMMVDVNYMYKLINNIYDDFENRKCSNCKHIRESDYSGWHSCNLEVAEETVYESQEAVVSSSFCCNKWEKKDGS